MPSTVILALVNAGVPYILAAAGTYIGLSLAISTVIGGLPDTPAKPVKS